MENLCILGEPYTGETKFQVGDVLTDVMFPSSERFTVISIEVQQVSPFHTAVIYELKSNRHGMMSGYRDIVEGEGRYEVVESELQMREFYARSKEGVKSGRIKRFEP